MFEVNINKIFNLLFHITLFVSYFYMSFPQLITSIFRVSNGYIVLYILVFVIGVLMIFCNQERNKWVANYVYYAKKAKWLLLFFILYFIWDIINFLYAQNHAYIVEKYTFILKMLALGCSVFIYVFEYNGNEQSYKRRLKNVFFNFGVIAVILAISSTLCYYLGVMTRQDVRIAPTADYNNYAITILIGWVSLVMLLLYSERNYLKKIIYFSLSSCICIPPIYLSASRRGVYILLLLIVIFLILSFVWVIKRKIYTDVKNMLCSIVFILICIILIILQINLFYSYNEKQAIEGISTNERIEQDVESTAVGARSDIWKCAINNIKDFNIKQLIIGGGGSYSNDIYMNNSEYTNKLIKIYENDKDKVSKLDPHNFILND